MENNGNNLKELLAISKLSTKFNHDEVETLKIICNSCQQLESIEVWSDYISHFNYLNGNETLEVIAMFTKKFCKLTIHCCVAPLFREEIEPCFYKLGKSYSTKITFFDYY